MPSCLPVPTNSQLSALVSNPISENPSHASRCRKEAADQTQGLELKHLLTPAEKEITRRVTRKPLPNTSESACSPEIVLDSPSNPSAECQKHRLGGEHSSTDGQEHRHRGECGDEKSRLNRPESPASLSQMYRQADDGHGQDDEPLNPSKGISTCPPGSTNPLPRPRSSFVHRLWLWEVVASAFSVACMAAIVGVLVHEQGRRLDQWGLGQEYLSPTVVVSFLGTLGKSACLLVVAEIISQLKWLHFEDKPQKLSDLQLFDNASRGPWGAFQLASSKNRKTLLASCASLLILASLFFGPSIQSVFRYPVVLTPVQGVTASILSSRVYDPFSLAHRFRQCYGPAKVDSLMQAAILSPVWNATRLPSLPCGFERCEWPTITTLGACSSCVDLTDTVVPTCNRTEPRPLYKAVDCNYTVPSSGAVFNAVFGMTGGASVQTRYSTVWNSVAGDEWEASLDKAWSTERGSSSTESRRAILSNFTFVKFSPDISFEGYSKEAPPVAQAMRCTIELCARTFTTPYFANFSTSPLTGPETGLITSPDDTTLGNEVKILVGLTPSIPHQLPVSTKFYINYCDYKGIALYLKDLFTTTTSTTGVVGTTHDTSTSGATQIRQRITPGLGLAFSQADDIAVLMQGIADSMTEAFRTSPNSTAVDGEVMSSVTYIAITWPRLALPISLVVLSTVMLVIVIVRNNMRGAAVWKSSSLALLFHELDGWDRADREVRDPKDVEKQASKMNARMVNEDGVLLFLKAERHASSRSS